MTPQSLEHHEHRWHEEKCKQRREHHSADDRISERPAARRACAKSQGDGQRAFHLLLYREQVARCP